MARDAMVAHARDELGIFELTVARPLQAPLTIAVGAALPLRTVVVLPPAFLVAGVSGAALLFLALLSAVGAGAGGANVTRATLRVTFWGASALALTAGIGLLFGVMA